PERCRCDVVESAPGSAATGLARAARGAGGLRCIANLEDDPTYAWIACMEGAPASPTAPARSSVEPARRAARAWLRIRLEPGDGLWLGDADVVIDGWTIGGGARSRPVRPAPRPGVERRDRAEERRALPGERVAAVVADLDDALGAELRASRWFSPSLDEAGAARGADRVDRLDAPDDVADLVRERAPALGEARRVGGPGRRIGKELAVPGERQRGLEENLRHRLGAPDAALEPVLLPERDARRQKRALVERG